MSFGVAYCKVEIAKGNLIDLKESLVYNFKLLGEDLD